MDKDTRNAIERATQRARKLLEDDFASQLEGTFDVLRAGTVAPKAGGHLSPRQVFQRDKIVAAIEHKRAAGMGAADAVTDYLRDTAFTALNRFVALKMLEARELVQECITKGEQSAGYREFCGLAAGVALLPESAGYRLYIESLFDELSTEVKVLFDRRDPSSVLWPKRASFEGLLEILNASDLAGVWGEDETIGWVYQFFNGADERKKMRDESQAPRNSRELAVRNQFFTPRYVVQFLTDNTLGRIWYEMRKGDTALARSCEYMVRQPNELFRTDPSMLENAPRWVARALDGDYAAIPEDLDFDASVHFAHGIDGYASQAARARREDESFHQRLERSFHETGRIDGSVADLWTALFLECRADRHSGGYGSESAKPYRNALSQALRASLTAKIGARAILVPHRAKKDPRDIRVLDPACGSGHFLLYAFDLLIKIYEEAWEDSHTSTPPWEATGQHLHDDYENLDELRKAVPGLILAHNLHGVDIDPRCAQIAQLALWMRAQKAYREVGIGRAERPQIRRSNIIVAEPLVAEDQLASQFVARLGDAALGGVFAALLDALKLAGDLGLLLRVETLVARPTSRGQTGDLFAPPEERIRAALARFVSEEGAQTSTRRRLFADDAAQGMGLLGVAEKKFDAVLMNPPFGAGSARAKNDFETAFPRTKNDVYAAFVERGIELLASRGRLGAITSRTGFFLSSFQKWREEILLTDAPPVVVVDLGYGVMDSATVEAAAYCLERRERAGSIRTTFVRLTDAQDKAAALREVLGEDRDRLAPSLVYEVDPDSFRSVPGSPFAYWVSPSLLRLFKDLPPFEANGRMARVGLQTSDDHRFLRLWWEVLSDSIGQYWFSFAKGGRFSPFYADLPLVVNWHQDGAEMKAFAETTPGTSHWSRNLRNTELYFRPGLTWPLRAVGLAMSPVPRGVIFSVRGYLATGPDEELLPMLGLMNARPFEGLFRVSLSGIRPEFIVGVLNTVPFPSYRDKGPALARQARIAWSAKRSLDTCNEISHAFTLPALIQENAVPAAERANAWHQRALQVDTVTACARAELDRLCLELYGIDEADGVAITQGVAGGGVEPVAASRHRGNSEEDDSDETGAAEGFDTAGLLTDLRSWLVGVAFGRFDPRLASRDRTAPQEPHPFDPLPSRSPAMWPQGLGTAHPDILLDDEGHPDDLVLRVRGIAERLGTEMPSDLRPWLAREFFPLHTKRYSMSGRKAPIYWQIATTSASYSVWLYIHAFTKDTLFRVQNDYVGPRLAHEERRLEAMTQELRGKANASERRSLAERATLVEELRGLLEEVKRVAPLWNPNLDDGVIINFAPLWRLVPQHKPWQKDLKSSWDALCEGKYDWAHLAMHLWPERVVPKCAKDRSLAIAHGLEDVFWVEGTDGKWTARKAATRPIDELVRERTSPAVKAALKSLLEAPAAQGGGGRGRGGRSRAAASADEGGSR